MQLHFKLGPEYKNEDFYVAAHHWAPSLIARNYDGSKANRPSRQFKTLLSRSEAQSHAWSMGESINNFESCMRRAGVLIEKTDARRQLIVQAPINPLSSARSYFQGLTGPRAVRLRERILQEQKQEPLAVSEAVSAASPRVSSTSSAIANSPDLTLLSVLRYQKYIRDERMKWNDNERHFRPKFRQCFQMLRAFYTTISML